MKTISSLLLFFACTVLSAEAQVFRAGVNLANISITNDGDVDDNSMLASFHAGFNGDIKMAPFLYFQPGILISGKGSKTQSGNQSDPTYYRATTNPLYVEIPANFVFKNTCRTDPFFCGRGSLSGYGYCG